MSSSKKLGNKIAKIAQTQRFHENQRNPVKKAFRRASRAGFPKSGTHTFRKLSDFRSSVHTLPENDHSQKAKKNRTKSSDRNS